MRTEPEDQSGLRAKGKNIPDLGHYKHVLALYDALLDGPRQALPDLHLVSVAVRAVEQAVADLEGVVNAFGDDARGGLPGAWEQDT